jgi:hypothetical protein
MLEIRTEVHVGLHVQCPGLSDLTRTEEISKLGQLNFHKSPFGGS